MSNATSRYLVHVAIVLKGSRDPEGETIHRSLVITNGYNSVNRVISGKYLGFLVESRSEMEAIKYIEELCMKARIYNPTVHKLLVLGVEGA
ncbi:phosphoribosylformylglycinamidine synthetase subunit PurS [Vulcanisaeta moutnovskia 768-28]|uniref:Phosphoribosylformylglycinamidine synthetase subunit PurS n=1 Tax=Vulcanisaeta moutnovskia (strain 768-28) TaxID=985053 RepID=F0QVX0_VULM7|nr:phosphoribosylformylglycinamidine synthase subunit PurS [Vulcanisaeta moutnovskia]ADY02144.1 phosphoribosylformylglycinamidine synthetase subunit PurS [Vulcanisaeta moutnovskia 768-28]